MTRSWSANGSAEHRAIRWAADLMEARAPRARSGSSIAGRRAHFCQVAGDLAFPYGLLP